MRTVAHQTLKVVSLTAGLSPTGTVASIQGELVRSRIQGTGALRAQAAQAILVDEPLVMYDIRPFGGWGLATAFGIQAQIQVERFAVGGGTGFSRTSLTPAYPDPTYPYIPAVSVALGGFANDFPWPTRDITGLMQAGLGNVQVDFREESIFRPVLTLTNHNVGAIQIAVITTFVSELKPIDIRREEGVFPVRQEANHRA